MIMQKPLAVKANPEVSKLFSKPSGQIKLPGNESLCRYGRISLQILETKRSYTGTKSSGSGISVVASGT